MPIYYSTGDILLSAGTVSGSRSDISALDNGGYVVAWRASGFDGDGQGVYGQRYDSGDGLLGSNFRANSAFSGNQEDLSVTGLADGGHVVTWISPDGDGDGIFAQRYGANGLVVGGEVPVSASPGDQSRPEVAALDDGGFVITWTSPDASDRGIFIQVYDAAGQAAFLTDFLVNVTESGEQFNSEVTGLAGGGFVVTWTSAGQDGDGDGVYARIFDSNGSPVDDEFRVNSITAGSQDSPAVAALPGGGFAVAWIQGTSVFAQVFDADGDKVGTETIVANAGFALESLSVAAGPGNGFIVTWNGDGVSGTDVFARLYDSQGQPLNDAVRTNLNTQSVQTLPVATTLADGSFVIAWDSLGPAIPNTRSVYGAHFRPSEDGFLTESGDLAWGTTASDYIWGLGGDDELQGHSGDDILEGGLGADTLDGGAGWDEVTYEGATASVSINLGNSGHTGEADGDSFSGIEQFSLSRFGDRFIGSAAAESVAGGGGADQLIGRGGVDVLDGGDGDDVLEGSGGADFLFGGEGVDEASYFRATARVTINLATGVHSGQALGDGFDSIERFTLTRFADTFVGGESNEIVSGGAGGDSLDGGLGADRLTGGRGDDDYFVDNAGDVVIELPDAGSDTVHSSVTRVLEGQVEDLVLTGLAAIDGTGNALANSISGNAAANRLDGRGGADEMVGRGGNDIYIVDDSADKAIEKSSTGGSDLVQSSASFALGNHVEKLTLTGSAAIDGSGNALRNTMVGNTGANRLEGGAGVDTIDGSGGADRIHGGTGKDILTGGAGADGFYFDTALNRATNVDKILDFAAADDTIHLDRAIFTQIAASGSLDPAAFRLGTAAADATDRIIYDQVSGKLFYDADGNGAATAILFAQVSAGTVLSAADFTAFI